MFLFDDFTLGKPPYFVHINIGSTRYGKFYMLNSIVVFLLLLTTWGILSGFFTPLFIALAVFSCALSVWFRYRMKTNENYPPVFSNLFRFPLYTLWLIKEIFKSTFAVARLVWTPGQKIAPSFAWIPTAQHSNLNKTIYANSITLTPGTVTVVVRGNQLGVHALENSSLEDLRNGNMDQTILKYFKEAL